MCMQRENLPRTLVVEFYWCTKLTDRILPLEMHV